MSLPFSLHLLTPWLAPEPFFGLDDLPVATRFRALVSSTDSLTRRLEVLTAAPSRVRLESQERLAVDTVDALLWGAGYAVPDGQEGLLSRNAWLTLGDRDLVFAHSRLALSGMPPAIRRAIEQGEEPLGTLFLAQDEPVERLDLHLALGHSPSLARRVGLEEAHRFLVRRSLFLVAGVVYGRILELFLMDLSR
ncbi:MAG: DUF98 domain-containing protein [Magnetococcales bacterium]|nr:DUF98 domain-containing protein [Magnetococcales bacterium]